MNIENIPKNKVTGYYWLSNSDKPIILNNTIVNFADFENANPFIQEAYFTDGNISYSIKHFDGKGHIISEAIVANFAEKTEHNYIADSAIIREGKQYGLDIKKLSFIQEWKEKNDPLCESMPVLQPAKIAFIGFDEGVENNGI